MDLRLLSFALGASSSLLWPWLPSFAWGGLLLSLLLPLAYYRAWRLLFLLFGILWMQANLSYRLAWLNLLGDQASHIITAQLKSAEPEGDKFVRLQLQVEQLDGQPLWPAPLVRVNAYQALPALTAGSRLILVSSLKPAHGLANEAGMDGRRLLLGKGITATGNLRRIIDIQPVAPGWRERWLAAAEASWRPLTHGPLLAALTFGEQGGITDEQWTLFRGSGITHIIAISGQHIALLLLLWAGWRWLPARWLWLPGVLAMVLALWPTEARWQLRVLDVGQGMAVLISKGDRAILYDTGDRYPGGYNMADAVILPQLSRLGIRVIDRLILSHKDRDHAGNRQRLLTTLMVRGELSSHRFDERTSLCQRGQQWRWQGLDFSVLWPEHPGGGRNNDGCVVRIRDGHTSVLLSADIERQAEQRLVALEGEGLASTLLVSPHHGSRTSSTPPFVAVVAPRYVVHSAGFMNQWGFPRPEVVARYRAARQWVTGLHGAILIQPEGGGLMVSAERSRGPWYRRDGAWWRPGLWPAP